MAALVAACLVTVASPTGSSAAGYVISVVSGDRQRVVMQDGGATFAPLVVKVTDSRGRDVAGVPVRFVCKAQHEGCYLGSLLGGVSATVPTRPDGRAVLGSGKYGVYVYSTRSLNTRRHPAPVMVIVSLPGNAASVTFHLIPFNPYSMW